MRFRAAGGEIQSLIGKVCKVNAAVVHRKIAAPVFVDPRSGVERRRVNIDCVALGIASHNHGASCLGGPHLDPINIFAFDAGLR